MCCGGGLAEKNCQYGVECALRFRETTPFLVREKGVFIPDRNGGVDVDRYGSQLISLNLLISIIA